MPKENAPKPQVDPLADHYKRDEGDKRRNKRYTLEEVTDELALKTNIDRSRWLDTIVAAVKLGDLPLKNPKNYSDDLSYAVPAAIRSFYDNVKADDVDKWLTSHPEWNVNFRFASGDVGGVPTSGTVRPTERRKRGDGLSPLIKRAVELAGLETADVWQLLVAWAEEKPPPRPLLEFRDNAIRFTNYEGLPQSATKKQITDRLYRLNASQSAKKKRAPAQGKRKIRAKSRQGARRRAS